MNPKFLEVYPRPTLTITFHVSDEGFAQVDQIIQEIIAEHGNSAQSALTSVSRRNDGSLARLTIENESSCIDVIDRIVGKYGPADYYVGNCTEIQISNRGLDTNES